VQPTGAIAPKKPRAEHTSTAQPRYIDSGSVKLKPW
jgi:hypothetical protein